MKHVVIVMFLVACGTKSEPVGAGSAATGSGSATGSAAAPAVAPPTAPVDKSPWCGAKPCPCTPDTKERPGPSDHECEISGPLVVQGVPCGAGHLQFYPDGKLKQCEQVAPYTVDGIECGGNWRISFHPTGKLARCASIKVPLAVGAFKMAGPNLALFPDGTLADGEIEGEIDLGGFRCRDRVRMYPGGKLQTCTVAAPAKRGDVELLAGDSVHLRPDGTLKNVTYGRKGVTVAGKVVPATNVMCFDAKEQPLDKPPGDCNDLVGEMSP